MKSDKIIKALSIITISAFLSVAASSAEMPSLRGCVLGETVQQFLSKSSALTASLLKCRNEKAKDPKKHRRDSDFCQSLIGAVDDNGYAHIDGVLSRGEGSGGEVIFLNGKVATIGVSFLSGPWDEIFADLTKMLGAPTRTNQETYQNGYGGTFYGSSAMWETNDFTAIATETVKSNTWRPVDVVLATKEGYALIKAAATRHSNTLE
jgi:hypothetical protein